MRTVWPTAIGVDNGGTISARIPPAFMAILPDLSMFKDETMDGVFSSHALEDFPERACSEDPPRMGARTEGRRPSRAYMCPSANLYPRDRAARRQPDHKWDIYPGDIETMLQDMALQAALRTSGSGGPSLKARNGLARTNIACSSWRGRRSRAGCKMDTWQRNPGGKKRALLIRFGAIGDQIVAASVLPGLKAQGYHVTYMTTPESTKVIEHDPNIDDWWVQATDYVPNVQLGPYWAS